MATEEHVDEIRQGPQRWNDYVRRSMLENGVWHADLHGADLRGADLHGANLRDANLADANLRDANLRDANLAAANLRVADLASADLHGADLASVDLYGADLHGADLHGANLRNADLTDANLADANLADANLRDANLRNANLADANLADANLRDANLRNANLRDAHLTDAHLVDADLHGAHLHGAHLTGADLTGADLHGAHLTATPRLDWARRVAYLHGAILGDTNPPVFLVDRTGLDQPGTRRSTGDRLGPYLRGAILTGSAEEGPAELVVEGPPELLVELEVPLGPAEPADVVVGIVTAVGVLADLAVTVGPRLDPGGPGLGGAGGGTVVLTAAESRDPIRVRRLRYGSPLVIELAESVSPGVAAAWGAGAAGMTLILKDLLKGPDKSGLLSVIFTLFAPKELKAYQRTRVARREADAAEEEARKREADRRGWRFTTQPASQDAVAERVAEATAGDAEAARAITEKYAGLKPLTDRHMAVAVSVPARPGDQRPPAVG